MQKRASGPGGPQHKEVPSYRAQRGPCSRILVCMGGPPETPQRVLWFARNRQTDAAEGPPLHPDVPNVIGTHRRGCMRTRRPYNTGQSVHPLLNRAPSMRRLQLGPGGPLPPEGRWECASASAADPACFGVSEE